MRSWLAMILAMMMSFPAVSSAQQDQSVLRRVHVLTGAGTIPRNPANRLEYLRYALTGEPRLTGPSARPPQPPVRFHLRPRNEVDAPQPLRAEPLALDQFPGAIALPIERLVGKSAVREDPRGASHGHARALHHQRRRLPGTAP